ncbi:MAG: hypothetical protein AAGH76_02560 [Pseudomonadota bacterium]
MSNIRASRASVTGALLLIVLPPLVFGIVAIGEGMSLRATVAALVEQYQQQRLNLAVLTAIGFVPLVVLGVWLLVRRMIWRTWHDAGGYVVAASAATALVVVFMHSEYWPTYLPSRVPAGFPHGLEFTIGPFVFGPVTVLLACVGVGLYRRSRRP